MGQARQVLRQAVERRDRRRSKGRVSSAHFRPALTLSCGHRSLYLPGRVGSAPGAESSGRGGWEVATPVAGPHVVLFFLTRARGGVWMQRTPMALVGAIGTLTGFWLP